jgi:hypothetical protein
VVVITNLIVMVKVIVMRGAVVPRQRGMQMKIAQLSWCAFVK